MKEWTTALPDWEQRIVDRKSLIPCGPLFPDEAKAALEVFKALRVVDIAGQPTFGEICDHWIFDFIEAIFGAYNAETGKRLVREFFLLISKKNGKSTLAAGIMLTALIRNWRHSAELIILAPTIEAAQNSFRPAADMIRADPKLSASIDGFLYIQDHLRQIKHLKTNATLKVLAADSATVVGKKASFILIDELWEFGTLFNADAILREAIGGLVARPEGFVISVSTMADKPPSGVFKSKLNYARNVRDGVVKDKKFLPVIYEFPQAMIDRNEYLKPANFYITNPNIGRSVSHEWLEDELRKEVAKSSDTRNVFLAKHLNIEVGINLRNDRWPGAEFWQKATDGSLDLDRVLDRSEVCVVGVDGGGLDDLFGVAVLGRCRETKNWLAWFHAWCHEGVLERRQTIASTLRDFQARGELTIVTDQLDDISAITAIIADIKGRGILGQVAVDPAGIGQLIDALGVPEIGITPENKSIIGAPQGYQMMSALKTAERKLANGTLWHHDSHLAKWCVSNIKIEPTATAIRPTKINAGDAKIDVAMAMFNAVTVMSMNPAKAPEYQMIFA